MSCAGHFFLRSHWFTVQQCLFDGPPAFSPYVHQSQSHKRWVQHLRPEPAPYCLVCDLICFLLVLSFPQFLRISVTSQRKVSSGRSSAYSQRQEEKVFHLSSNFILFLTTFPHKYKHKFCLPMFFIPLILLNAGPEFAHPTLVKTALTPLASVGASFQYPPINWSAVLSPLMRLSFGEMFHTFVFKTWQIR